MTRRIYITGVIGSGKSTVAKELARKFVGSRFSETVNEKVLDLVYHGSNTDIQALNQVALLFEMYRAHDYALLNNTQVFDTSFFTNLFFSKCLLTGDLYEYHNRLWKQAVQLCEGENDYNVFIEINYETMLDRIEQRGREFEQNDDFDFKSYYVMFTTFMRDMIERNANSKHFIVVKDNGHKTPDEIADEIFNKIMEVENGSI